MKTWRKKQKWLEINTKNSSALNIRIFLIFIYIYVVLFVVITIY